MKVVTASDKDYLPMVKYLTSISKKSGYDTHIELVSVKKNDYEGGIQKCPYKPHVVKKSLKIFKDDVLWVDGDACIMKPFKVPKCDVLVTMRRQQEYVYESEYRNFSSYLNSGVVFIKNNEEGRRFVDMWIDQIPVNQFQSDQGALNDLVLRVTNLTEYDKVFELNGVKIYIACTDIWNNYYFDETSKNALILHCKACKGDLGIVKQRLKEYLWGKYLVRRF